MKNKFVIGTRLSLTLSLAISSSLVANVVRAESHHPNQFAVDELSQTIAKLIDLDPDRHSLINSALNRALASKETSSDIDTNTTGAIVTGNPNDSDSVNRTENSKPRKFEPSERAKPSILDDSNANPNPQPPIKSQAPIDKEHNSK
jgi:hypothetical protein